jgi:hypothetical protein
MKITPFPNFPRLVGYILLCLALKSTHITIGLDW